MTKVFNNNDIISLSIFIIDTFFKCIFKYHTFRKKKVDLFDEIIINECNITHTCLNLKFNNFFIITIIFFFINLS